LRESKKISGKKKRKQAGKKHRTTVCIRISSSSRSHKPKGGGNSFQGERHEKKGLSGGV